MDLPQAQKTLMVTPTTRPWRARALAVIAAVLAALAVWLVTDPLLGVDLAAPTTPGSQQLQPVTPALIPGLAATGPSVARPAPAREQEDQAMDPRATRAGSGS